MTSQNGSFPTFLIAVYLAAFSMGVHTLLFPWLIVGELGVSADKAGFALMLSMLPSTFLLLWGGAYSDGRHLGKLLLRLYCFFILPYGFLCFSYFWLSLSFPLVLVFGISFGVVTSFVQPARETLLGVVAIPPMQKSVAKAVIAQSLGMGSGTLMGGLLIQWDLILAIAVQVLLFVVTGFLMYRSSPTKKVAKPKTNQSSSKGVISGLNYAMKSPQIRSLLFMVSVTGFLGFGFYFVMLPLMTREIYQAGASFLAGLQAVFMLGGVFLSFVIVRLFGSFRHPGRVLVIATILRGALLLLIAIRLPVWLIFPAIFLWGVLSNFSTIVGRTLIQEVGADEYRGRLISLYQLSIFGVGPFGALCGGFLIENFGILPTTAALGLASVVFGLGYIVIKNTLWNPSKAASESN